jgi:UDP-N-acetylglucosamine 2-epimerase (non-hydrolysing)
MKRLLLIVGARPNFVKADPILRALESGEPWCLTTLVHTGQHFDEAMSQSLFTDLGLREPDINLGISGGSHAEQTARVLVAIETLLLDSEYDLVIVVGDVNSTLAATLAAAKLNIPVAHVEAGLRSNDRSMPEEINRLCTDAISSLLFTTSQDANMNLGREGVPTEKVFFVGNVMIDTMLRILKEIDRGEVLQRHGLVAGNYALLTAHRPANVDSVDGLNALFRIVESVATLLPVVFPVHPRTLQRLEDHGLMGQMCMIEHLELLPPQTYREFLALQAEAAIVLTDSGGVQEETTALGIPCLTLRDNTERPVTVTEGTNTIVGLDPERVWKVTRERLAAVKPTGRCPDLWDGHAAERIVAVIRRFLANEKHSARERDANRTKLIGSVR